MKIFAERFVETEVDLICDVCKKSVLVEKEGAKYKEYGELNATFGYGSRENGNVYHLDLCESCFKVALSSLRMHHRSRFLFDDADNSDENFGLNLERITRSNYED